MASAAVCIKIAPFSPLSPLAPSPRLLVLCCAGRQPLQMHRRRRLRTSLRTHFTNKERTSATDVDAGLPWERQRSGKKGELSFDKSGFSSGGSRWPPLRRLAAMCRDSGHRSVGPAGESSLTFM